jgi:NTP pyrophosphatase (non-canonical NTP hydrolase)
MSDYKQNSKIKMNLPELLKQIRAFRDERDWAQFHNPKDMAAALAIEVAELQEIFLWKTGEEIAQTAEKKRSEIEDEVADVAVYLLEFADNQGIDIEAAILAKMEKNAVKYPVQKSKGSSTKYTDL